MSRLNKIITKTGDSGMTNLVSRDVHKSNPIIECIGAIDEANSFIGHARNTLVSELSEFAAVLDSIQNNLFDLSADLICGTNKVNQEYIKILEEQANKANESLGPLTSFILPKGSSSSIHVARAVVRRAERAFWAYAQDEKEYNSDPGVYLNRLSDLLFIICRVINQSEKEELWQRLK